MINRGKRNVYLEIFAVAWVCTCITYFTVALFWVMAKDSLIVFWQMAKGWFV